MCFSKELSKRALGLGLFSSLLLIFLGDRAITGFNRAIGLFFIVVALVQLLEYFIWSDPNCNQGLNELAGKLGPFFVVLQPVILLILILIFMRGAAIDQSDLIPIIINLAYLAYFIYSYHIYWKSRDFCSRNKTDSGQLLWSWSKHFSQITYTIVLIINIVYYSREKIHYLTAGVVGLIALFSQITYPKGFGSVWCYVSNSVPLIVLLLEHYATL